MKCTRDLLFFDHRYIVIGVVVVIIFEIIHKFRADNE